MLILQDCRVIVCIQKPPQSLELPSDFLVSLDTFIPHPKHAWLCWVESCSLSLSHFHWCQILPFFMGLKLSYKFWQLSLLVCRFLTGEFAPSSLAGKSPST